MCRTVSVRLDEIVHVMSSFSVKWTCRSCLIALALTSKRCWTLRLFLQMTPQRWRTWWFQWTWAKTRMETRPNPPPRPPVSRTARPSRKVSCSAQSHTCLTCSRKSWEWNGRWVCFPGAFVKRSCSSVCFWGQLSSETLHMHISCVSEYLPDACVYD